MTCYANKGKKVLRAIPNPYKNNNPLHFSFPNMHDRDSNQAITVPTDFWI
jgi:hypothetical protein